MSEPRDELASAYLDREATPDEVAEVESTPELLDRVEQFREVARRNAEPPSPPADLKTRQIDRALELFDDLGALGELAPIDAGAVPTPTPNAPVVPLRRRARSAWAASAAAALVVVAGLGFAVDRLGDRSDREATEAVASDASGAAESPLAGPVTAEAARAESDAVGALADEAAPDQAEDDAMAADSLSQLTTTAPTDRSFTAADDPFEIAAAVGLTKAGPSHAAPDGELETITNECVGVIGIDRAISSAFITYDRVPAVVVRTTSAPDRVVVFDRSCAVLVDVVG